MSILESLFVGIFGMAVVFVVLIGLSLLLRLQSALITRFSKRKPAKVCAAAAAEAVSVEAPPVSCVPTAAPPGVQVPAAPPESMPHSAPAFHTRTAAAGNEVVTAPVAGTVIEIMTSVGARVKRGDLLLLLEAMKMENGIAATRDGTVTHILTCCGKSVIAGTPLVMIQ